MPSLLFIARSSARGWLFGGSEMDRLTALGLGTGPRDISAVRIVETQNFKEPISQ